MKILRKTLTLIFILIFNFTLAFSGNIKGTVKTIDGSLENAVVYIEKISGKSFPAPDKPTVLDQIDLTFVPHVLPVLIGTTVSFPNSDATRHSVFSPSNSKKIDLGTYSPGSSKSVVFDKAGVFPLLCHVHPEMSSFIIVVETPYFAVSDESGHFLIKDVPPGRYKLTIWHETAKGKAQQIDVSARQETTVNFILEE
jgi:plastocyanin